MTTMPFSLSRRRALQGLAAGLAAGAAPRLALSLADDGYRVLSAGPSRQRLHLDGSPESDLWSFDGGTPGPEIRARAGERVRVRLVNGLDEPTTIHWHGIRIDNAMDGVPGLTQEAVPPGGSFDYDFVVPDAGSYWYHAHNRTWNQIARGLYGPLVVEEAEPAIDREHELTLMLDDWRLDAERRLELESLGSLHDWSHDGRLGNWLTVDGTSRPEHRLNAGETYRLRLVNASNARVLALNPGRFGATIVALDGQALAEPVAARDAVLPLSPAQRMDLLVTPHADFALEELTGEEPFVAARFAVGGAGAAPDEGEGPPLPRIAANALPEPDVDAATRVELRMTGGAMGDLDGIVHEGRPLSRERMRETGQVWAFNGVANLAETPLFDARRGESIVVEARNDTAFAHAIHLHGHHFRVLAPGEPGLGIDGAWRDTVLVAPREALRIAFVADNPGDWLLHCHMVEHAAAGMNAWYRVAS